MSPGIQQADKHCPICRKDVPYHNNHCYSCGYDYPPSDETREGSEPSESELRPVVVWSYPGRTQADAAQTFAKHAHELAAQGYVPVSQSWGDGRPGMGRVLAIGLFAGSIRPKGYLTVTYYRQIHAPSEPTDLAPDVLDQIRRLGELRDAGFVSPAEFEAKKAELLGRL